MTPDTPRWHHLYEALARTATHLREQREAGYPAQVAKGTMTQADADAAIAEIRAIEADWLAVVAGAPLPADTIGQPRKLRTLQAAYRRTAAIAAANPQDADAVAYAELVETLLWQQQDWHCTSRIRWFHGITLELRAAAA